LEYSRSEKIKKEITPFRDSKNSFDRASFRRWKYCSKCSWKTLPSKSCEQGKNRREYVDWIWEIFKEWVLKHPSYDKKRNSWKFYTISHSEITEYRKIFYRGSKKIIPAKIDNYLKDSLSLAVWFMDDGASKEEVRAYTISTHSFSKGDNKKLIQCLRKRFNLNVHLHWDGKGNRLYIPVKEAPKFENLILPYIIPSMKYKFPLTP
jgi:hypothetical protein